MKCKTPYLFAAACALVAPLAQAGLNVNYDTGGPAAFSFSDLAFTSFGAGTGTLTSSIKTNEYSSVTPLSPKLLETVGHTTVVAIAPTATSTGVAYDYDVNRYIGQATYANWSQNVATINVGADGSLLAGEKYIWITGKITAIADLGVGYQSSANALHVNFGEVGHGGYTTGSSPLLPGIPTVNAAVSFYFGTGAAAALPTAVASTTSYASASSTYLASTANSSSSATDAFTLTGGTTLDFSALIYATDGAALKNFELNLYSGQYSMAIITGDLGSSYTQQDYVGSRILPAIPEPSSYAMLLAGLGMLGWSWRRSASRRHPAD